MIPPDLATTDEHAPYKNSFLKTYGHDYRPRRNAKVGRKRKVNCEEHGGERVGLRAGQPHACQATT